MLYIHRQINQIAGGYLFIKTSQVDVFLSIKLFAVINYRNAFSHSCLSKSSKPTFLVSLTIAISLFAEDKQLFATGFTDQAKPYLERRNRLYKPVSE